MKAGVRLLPTRAPAAWLMRQKLKALSASNVITAVGNPSVA